MSKRAIELSWIVVSDLEAAIEFYVNKIGLKVDSFEPDYGWAELKGTDGMFLGLAQANEQTEFVPGGGAVVTVSVDDITAAIKEFNSKGVTLVGDVVEVPEIVKLQTFTDQDGNKFQLVEDLVKKS